MTPKTITGWYMQDGKAYNEYSDGTYWLASEWKWGSKTTPTITGWYSQWGKAYNEYSDWTTGLASDWKWGNNNRITTPTTPTTPTTINNNNKWNSWNGWADEDALAAYREQIAELNDKISELNDTVSEQKAQINDLNTQVSQLTSEKEQLQGENERLQNKVVTLQNKINNLESDGTDFEQSVSNAQTKYNNAEEGKTTSVDLNTNTIENVDTSLWDRINTKLTDMGYFEKPSTEVSDVLPATDNVVNDTNAEMDNLTAAWWDVQQMKVKAAQTYRNSEAKLKQMLDNWEIDQLQYNSAIDKIKAHPSMKILYS